MDRSKDELSLIKWLIKHGAFSPEEEMSANRNICSVSPHEVLRFSRLQKINYRGKFITVDLL
jgi:hypothetical protein